MGWEDKVSNLLGRCTSEAAFGISVTHTPSVGDPQTLLGVWFDTYETVSPESGIPIMSDEPMIGFRLSDFDTAPSKGDQITKGGVNYFVRTVEPDGEGGVNLMLEREV